MPAGRVRLIQLNHPTRKDECTGVRMLSQARPPTTARREGARRRGARRAAGLAAGLALGLGAVVLGGLAAGPSAAEVTLTPAEGVQGDAAEITFGVSEDRAPAQTTRIQIVMPDAHPVAEVYPLSTDAWAPMIAYRTLPTALPGVHGAQSNSVVSTITWTRAGAPAAATPGAVNELRISLGPLPQTSDLRFLVVQTYSDGVVKRWVNPVMKLTAPAGQEGQPAQPTAPAHGDSLHPGGGVAAGTPVESEGGNLGIVVGVVVALVIGVAIGGAVVASSRMRPQDDGGNDGGGFDEEDGDGGPGGVAGAGVPASSGSSDPVERAHP